MKVEIMAALDSLGYWTDEYEGTKASKVVNEVIWEDTEYGYGYDVVQFEVDALEDFSYVDMDHKRWYLESVINFEDDIYTARTWSAERPEKVEVRTVEEGI